MLHIRRKQVNGKVGPFTRKKRALNEYPVPPELAAILGAHREAVIAKKDDGDPSPRLTWIFPSSTESCGRRRRWMTANSLLDGRSNNGRSRGMVALTQQVASPVKIRQRWDLVEVEDLVVWEWRAQ